MSMLSVVIPVFNEARTIREIVARVRAVPLDMEMIIVDDCSKDGTADVFEGLRAAGGRCGRLPRAEPGQGCRAAERLREATGDMVIVQDADLEYDPAEYPKLVQPILDGKADVVFGSRFIGGESTACCTSGTPSATGC